MLSGDLLEFALVTIMRVAEIASKLGAEAKRQRCDDLAAELMITGDYLDNDISTQEHQLRLRVSKVEGIRIDMCRISEYPQRDSWPPSLSFV